MEQANGVTLDGERYGRTVDALRRARRLYQDTQDGLRISRTTMFAAPLMIGWSAPLIRNTVVAAGAGFALGAESQPEISRGPSGGETGSKLELSLELYLRLGVRFGG
ncbi:MAG: hypothetical protein ABI867_33430 [Kofleriaceae bacterium]